VNDAAEFALWLSPHILDNTTRVLMAVVGTPREEADDYQEILAEIADASGGGTLTPPRTVNDCRDHDDNLVLDLAAEVGALLLVSEDTDLTSIPGAACRYFERPSSAPAWTPCDGTSAEEAPADDRPSPPDTGRATASSPCH
jgi:hypothetical protein